MALAHNMPSTQALADLLSMLQQHDYETVDMAIGPLAQQAHKSHILALEARLERVTAGAPKPGDVAKLARWARDWFDGGFGEDAGWDAAEAWVYGQEA